MSTKCFKDAIGSQVHKLSEYCDIIGTNINFSIKLNEHRCESTSNLLKIGLLEEQEKVKRFKCEFSQY